MKILIKSAKIISPENKFHLKKVDILVENGKISKIGAGLKTKADKTIELKNLHLSEGWFDSSVSFGEPGYEERETIAHGLEVAAKSGFTSIALNPNTYPIVDTSSSVAFLKGKARGKATKLYPIGALTKKGEGKELAELYDMRQTGAVAFGDFKAPVEDPALLKIALQYAQNFDGLLLSFPQEQKMAGKGQVNEGPNSTLLGLKGIPPLAENLRVARDLYLLEYTGGKLHIPTISTEKSLELIKTAKKKGLDITCSVAVHNLFFTDEKLKEFDSNYKVLPPLREEKDRKAMVKGVKDGTIDMVTSDHCPIDIEHKKLEMEHAMYGTIGLESAFGALQKLFDTETCIRVLTSGKNRFSVPGLNFEEGEKADFTLFIPGEEYSFTENEILSTSKNSIFLGEKLKGKVVGVFNNNKLVV